MVLKDISSTQPHEVLKKNVFEPARATRLLALPECGIQYCDWVREQRAQLTHG